MATDGKAAAKPDGKTVSFAMPFAIPFAMVSAPTFAMASVLADGKRSASWVPPTTWRRPRFSQRLRAPSCPALRRASLSAGSTRRASPKFWMARGSGVRSSRVLRSSSRSRSRQRPASSRSNSGCSTGIIFSKLRAPMPPIAARRFSATGSSPNIQRWVRRLNQTPSSRGVRLSRARIAVSVSSGMSRRSRGLGRR